MKTNALRPQQLDAARSTDTNPKTGKPITQLTDGAGLYLKLQWIDGKRHPKGHSWRFDYTRPTTKARNTMVLGTYPGLSLADARAKAAELRGMVSNGVDPMERRAAATALAVAAQQATAADAERDAKGFAPAGTLQGVAQDYHELQVSNGNWSDDHAAGWLSMFSRKVFTNRALSLKPIADVTPIEVRDLLAGIEQSGQVPTARALRKYMGNVWDYAISHGLATVNAPKVIAQQLNRRHKGGNNPAVTTGEALAPVLRAIRDYEGQITRAALMVQVTCFQRPSDTCAMRWDQLDLDAGLWFIPAESDDAGGTSKIATSLSGNDHVSPLPRQLVAELRALQTVTGWSEWVFPSYSSQREGLPIANDALSQALRDMGFKGQQTPHGLRATARTMIEEVLDIRAVYIEAQLAHKAGVEGLSGGVKRDVLGTAYNRATHLDKRVAMIQKWADYLDSLLAGPDALPGELVKLPG
jgi:integrase